MSEIERNAPQGEIPEEKKEAQGATLENTQAVSQEAAELEISMDEVSYPIGEVPQSHLLDPEVHLSLNSEKLNQNAQMMEGLVQEAESIIQEEVTQIQKLQKSIDQWESKIEKNKALVEKNNLQAKQNNKEIAYDKKNRDYWACRAEQVVLDFSNASVSGREDSWNWLIKKYGLKNPDGTPIDARNHCVDELCNGEASNLSGEYRSAANKYELSKKDKEEQNLRLAKENAKHKNGLETLQKYIQSAYTYQIEPLQDGVLLLKELSAKLKSFASQEEATFGDLREWAEQFLDEYLQENPRTHQSVINDFRRLASIPLPPEFT